MNLNEIIFFVTKSTADGGFTARAMGHSIFTEGDTLEKLDDFIVDAVRCHFNKDKPYRFLFVDEPNET